MIPWTDPLVLGGLVLLLLFLARGGHSLWCELQFRRRRRLLQQKEVRLVVCDYRARYGGDREALRRLEEDVESARTRLEELAAAWKASQMRADEAEGETEGRLRREEEQRAYQAFLREARRFKHLREAQGQLRR